MLGSWFLVLGSWRRYRKEMKQAVTLTFSMHELSGLSPSLVHFFWVFLAISGNRIGSLRIGKVLLLVSLTSVVFSLCRTSLAQKTQYSVTARGLAALSAREVPFAHNGENVPSHFQPKYVLQTAMVREN